MFFVMVEEFCYSIHCHWLLIIFFFHFIRSLFDRTGVEHRVSSPYHPQNNGLDERMNQTLVHTLTKMTSSEDDWDLYIEAALYAYRIGIQDSSRFSPFLLLYNRHPRKAIDHELIFATAEPMSTAGTVTPDKMIANMLEMRKEYHQKAQSNIKRAQERQEYFDAKHDNNHMSDELKKYTDSTRYN